MRLNQLINPGRYKFIKHTTGSKFWTGKCHDLTQDKLQEYFHELNEYTTEEELTKCKRFITRKILDLKEVGGVNTFFEPCMPSMKIEAKYLEETINKMPLSRGAACWFSISMGWQLNQTANYKWSDFKTTAHSINKKAYRIASSMPRALNCEYVFWESKGELTYPIVMLEDYFLGMTGFRFSEVLKAQKSNKIVGEFSKDYGSGN